MSWEGLVHGCLGGMGNARRRCTQLSPTSAQPPSRPVPGETVGKTLAGPCAPNGPTRVTGGTAPLPGRSGSGLITRTRVTRSKLLMCSFIGLFIMLSQPADFSLVFVDLLTVELPHMNSAGMSCRKKAEHTSFYFITGSTPPARAQAQWISPENSAGTGLPDRRTSLKDEPQFEDIKLKKG